MKKFYLLALLLVGLMTSCQKEEFVSVSSNPGFDVTASMELPQTRTQLGEQGNVLWSENDAFSMFNAGKHYKYTIDVERPGVGTGNASFKYVPGDLTGGIEGEGSLDVFVAVYPYDENTTVVKNGNDYSINTVIPTTQNYVAGSFGQNASPMVAVNTKSPNFLFMNVASMLCLPLKGEATIVSATLESKAHKIAGAAVVTAVAEKGFEPVVNVENGESKIVMSCGQGVELKADEATNFYFVLAPGTYEANDLVITFYDNKGNYFVTEIAAENTFERRIALGFSERTFTVTGTEKVKQKVVAKVGANMVADRVVPSLKTLAPEALCEWATELKCEPNTAALIKEAASYAALKNYRAAFDLLNGIPGFELQTKTLNAFGLGECEIGGLGYAKSFVDDLQNVKDIESLLEFLKEFEKVYEASGLKGKLDEMVVNSSSAIDALIDKVIEGAVNQNPGDVDDSVIFTEYKAKVKEQLDNSISGLDAILNALISGRSGVKNPLYPTLGNEYIVAPNPNFAKDEEASIKAYLAAAEALVAKWDTLNSKTDVENEIKALPKLQFSVTIPVVGTKYEKDINPESFLTGADTDYAAKLAELIKNNEDAIIALKAGYKTILQGIIGESFTDKLAEVVKDTTSIEYKLLSSLFANEEFLNIIKNSLKTAIDEIEAAAKDKVDANNKTALEAAVENALLAARTNAITQVWNELDKLNDAELAALNSGIWGLLKGAMGKPEVINAFTTLGIGDVYTALCELAEVVEGVVVYSKGSVNYDIEDMKDYKENVDWWLVNINE